ncbi:DUF3090 domain-containing protein [Spelaeicoccus albus]|uniref:Putative repeat protein (TIGR03847 family) n=1 Tax=Spelaeicoccus albus TaxID=1280376 RepID=A0A7Z0D3X8_9MICO|nr:DUF3090 domain-containing protein [Spelaeicoccus albus]NYI68427.1 putative repeat protein (TIGR03847 family) [Spelaeicoccus albus]
MPPIIYQHDHPDRFVAGTIGMPGERQFFLQAKSGRTVNSVALEKQQVQALAERIDELLDVVVRRAGGDSPVPAAAREADRDNAELDMPATAEFQVGTMSLAWDTEENTLVIECFPITETEEGEEEDTSELDRLRVVLDGAQGREFVRRSKEVVAAGRPDCPFCSRPLEPGGHICPRANGVKR